MPRSVPPLRFDNRFVRELPADPSTEPGRRQVHGALYSRVQPTPVAAPRLVAWSRECADLLGLAEEDVTSPAFAEAMAGNALVPGSEPYAANYGGHQFGHWAGQLGDGRAITLGEAVNAAGQRLELQLKGAGPTPYSRSADGRAVLRSSVREFLVSEAMHHLGVPTTRALCLVATGEDVIRDMFYDGRPRAEPGAIVCRVSAISSCRPRGATSRCSRVSSSSRSGATLRSSSRTASRSTRHCAPAGSPRSASAPRSWSRTGCGSASCTG